MTQHMMFFITSVIIVAIMFHIVIDSHISTIITILCIICSLLLFCDPSFAVTFLIEHSN